MEKTVMQKHLDWLKGIMVVSPQMESQLLEEEKKQHGKTWDDGLDDDSKYSTFEQYYSKTFKQD